MPGFIHTKPRYTVNDLLQLLGIARVSLYKEINSGRLGSYKVGKRRFVSPRALDDYIALSEKEAGDQ